MEPSYDEFRFGRAVVERQIFEGKWENVRISVHRDVSQCGAYRRVDVHRVACSIFEYWTCRRSRRESIEEAAVCRENEKIGRTRSAWSRARIANEAAKRKAEPRIPTVAWGQVGSSQTSEPHPRI